MRLATMGSVRLPNHSIRLMSRMLSELGFDCGPAFKSAGLARSTIAEATGTVSGVQELAFQREFLRMTPDQPALWLGLGARYRLLSHAHTDYGLLMSTAPSVDAALKVGFTYGDLYYMLADAEGIFNDAGVQTGFRSLPTEMPEDLRRFSALRDVAVNCAVFADLWGGPFAFDRVELPLPHEVEPLVRPFLRDAELVFEAEFSCWRWSARIDLKKPPQSDPMLHDFYRQACDRHLAEARRTNDLVDRVAMLMTETQGQVSIDDAARQLGMSGRTLQRRLAERGLNYRDLTSLKRHQNACRLLVETDEPIGRIALEVGYDNVSSFNFAFRRHSGTSPSSYRRGLLDA